MCFIYVICRLAIAKVADLARRAASVTIRLDTQPTELLGFVEFMQYFEECDKQIEQMMQEIDYAYDCFMLMKDYNLQVDDVAKEEFMGKLTKKTLLRIIILTQKNHRLRRCDHCT